MGHSGPGACCTARRTVGPMSYDTHSSDLDTNRAPRTPADILDDIEAACGATSEFEATAASPGVDVMELVFEVIDDIRSSFVLAMESAGVADAQLREVVATVGDYVANQYGD